ncbi:hypothetical protein OF83DRAFT_684553 [Amylostereum chailletii]|nr:hypothetical protein OF83DRAFT_684553 [Amylostereum chailletii]
MSGCGCGYCASGTWMSGGAEALKPSLRLERLLLAACPVRPLRPSHDGDDASTLSFLFNILPTHGYPLPGNLNCSRAGGPHGIWKITQKHPSSLRLATGASFSTYSMAIWRRTRNPDSNATKYRALSEEPLLRGICASLCQRGMDRCTPSLSRRRKAPFFYTTHRVAILASLPLVSLHVPGCSRNTISFCFLLPHTRLHARVPHDHRNTR